MAELDTATALQPPAPATGPSPGMDSFISEVMTGIDSPEAPAAIAPAKPAEPPPQKQPTEKPTLPKPAEKQPEKPAPKETLKTSAKPEPAKPAAKEDLHPLRVQYNELLTEKKKTQSEIAKLQEENKTLAAKRWITPEMEKEIEDNKAEIARLRKEMAQSSYERSDDFKTKFAEPYKRTIDGTIAMVEQMQTAMDDEGQTRKATADDFWQVARAPIAQQAEIAQKIFGNNAARILTQIDKLTDLHVQADAAIKSQRDTLQTQAAQKENEQREQHKQFETLRAAARTELTTKYPQFFAPDEADPEASAELAKGFEFYDKVMSEAGSMKPDQLAAYQEVLRARVAWFPRGLRENNRLKEENASLKEELAKYRASDPGAEREKGKVTAPADDEVKGIEGMAAEIERAAQS